MPDAETRFWKFVVFEPMSGCWLWSGHTNHDGYGRFNFGGWTGMAHRFSYAMAKGTIPKGLTIDHLCRNRGCVNPDHLEAVTQGENVMRGETLPAIQSRRKTCPKGHPFTPENTELYRGKHRRCKQCGKEQDAKRYRDNREQHLQKCKQYRESKRMKEATNE